MLLNNCEFDFSSFYTSKTLVRLSPVLLLSPSPIYVLLLSPVVIFDLREMDTSLWHNMSPIHKLDMFYYLTRTCMHAWAVVLKLGFKYQLTIIQVFEIINILFVLFPSYSHDNVCRWKIFWSCFNVKVCHCQFFGHVHKI